MSVDQVRKFIDALNLDLNDASYKGDPSEKANVLVGYFCDDNASVPSVGLADDGPNFLHKDKIIMLFTQLFTSFPKLRYHRIDPVMQGGSKYALPGKILTGRHDVAWFREPPFKSQPISDLTPKGRSSILPACSVFTFDNSDSLITNLAIYFDRWKMAQDLS